MPRWISASAADNCVLASFTFEVSNGLLFHGRSFRLLPSGLWRLGGVKFLLRNRVLLPQFLMRSKSAAARLRWQRPRRHPPATCGVRLGCGDLLAIDLYTASTVLTLASCGAGGRLLLRDGDGIVRRVNFHEQIVRADHLVVEDVNAGDLAGNPRRDGNDVRGDERVVGGFMCQCVHEIAEAEEQQRREHEGRRPEKQRRVQFGKSLAIDRRMRRPVLRSRLLRRVDGLDGTDLLSLITFEMTNS